MKNVEIKQRTLHFSILAVSLFRKFRLDPASQIVARQFLRAATSIGANMYEAQGAQSKADFIAKVSISYKESLETGYWLELARASKFLTQSELDKVMDEAVQISKILSSILLTSKRGKRLSEATLA